MDRVQDEEDDRRELEEFIHEAIQPVIRRIEILEHRIDDLTG